MIKVSYEYLESFPQGGSAKWVNTFELYEDNITPSELQQKIKDYCADTHSGYRNHISATNTERL